MKIVSFHLVLEITIWDETTDWVVFYPPCWCVWKRATTSEKVTLPSCVPFSFRCLWVNICAAHSALLPGSPPSCTYCVSVFYWAVSVTSHMFTVCVMKAIVIQVFSAKMCPWSQCLFWCLCLFICCALDVMCPYCSFHVCDMILRHYGLLVLQLLTQNFLVIVIYIFGSIELFSFTRNLSSDFVCSHQFVFKGNSVEPIPPHIRLPGSAPLFWICPPKCNVFFLGPVLILLPSFAEIHLVVFR